MTLDDWRELARDLGGALRTRETTAVSRPRRAVLTLAVQLLPSARAEYASREHAPMPPTLIAEWPFLVWNGYRQQPAKEI